MFSIHAWSCTVNMKLQPAAGVDHQIHYIQHQPLQRQPHSTELNWSNVNEQHPAVLFHYIQKLTLGSILFSAGHTAQHISAFVPLFLMENHVESSRVTPVCTPTTLIQSLFLLYQVIAQWRGLTLQSDSLLCKEGAGLIITNLPVITISLCPFLSILLLTAGNEHCAKQTKTPSQLIPRQHWHGNRYATSPGG